MYNTIVAIISKNNTNVRQIKNIKTTCAAKTFMNELQSKFPSNLIESDPKPSKHATTIIRNPYIDTRNVERHYHVLYKSVCTNQRFQF